ncbi:hypothetical protein L208DRAFT_1375570 [Tricholoma matsutake]|nr:hypothetical protein L208DRAFT_1375570 [Tricholoma matsutake 945]
MPTDPISQNAGDSGPDDEDFPTVLGATATDQLNTSSTHTCKQFGHLVKSHMNLSDQAEAALSNFCMNTSSIDEFLILLYAKVLQLEDMGQDAKKLEASQGLLDDLKKNICMYTHTFILLPNITAYCGNCVENVLIDDSMAVDSPTYNIAELTQAVLKKTSVPPTLQLYMHLAVLCWHFLQYPDTFNNIYNEDKAKFGDPANTSHQATDLKHVPDWIVVVNNHASKVLGGQTKKKKGKGLKRKHLSA